MKETISLIGEMFHKLFYILKEMLYLIQQHKLYFLLPLLLILAFLAFITYYLGPAAITLFIYAGV
ncbi:MAG: hypothetical protein KKH94_07315 [Candidatus Omnitrophica bacterium]|nr:hypothetical protein [Candidatus Omnitrophota bacterium]